MSKLSTDLSTQIALLQFVDDKHRLSYFDEVMPYVIKTLERYEELDSKATELTNLIDKVSA